LLLQQLQDQDASIKSLEVGLQKALDAACSSKHPAVISYLLDNGAKLEPWNLRLAIDDDTPVSIFETFLNHGWDVNEMIGGLYPPLRQVVRSILLIDSWLMNAT
jgi:hypothetical protein